MIPVHHHVDRFPLAGLLIAILCGLIMGGCAPAAPADIVQLGTVLVEEDFSQPFRWQVYRQPGQNVDFRPEDGIYRAQAWDGGFSWALYDAASFTDTVIQVDTEQRSPYRNNAYGLMCRASATDNGDGYYFFISGDGYYSIRARTRAGMDDIVPFTRTDAIQQDRAFNRVRVACIADRLLLWINGQFIIEVRDSRFDEGYIGLTAAVPADGEVDIAFDAVRVWQGSFAPPP